MIKVRFISPRGWGLRKWLAGVHFYRTSSQKFWGGIRVLGVEVLFNNFADKGESGPDET